MKSLFIVQSGMTGVNKIAHTNIFDAFKTINTYAKENRRCQESLSGVLFDECCRMETENSDKSKPIQVGDETFQVSRIYADVK